MLRLDKFITNNTFLSRSEATTAIRYGQVTIDNKIVLTPELKISGDEQICLNGGKINNNKYVYIMLNKPSGVVSSTDDKKSKTVLSLIPKEYEKFNLFPCGRLDKDTLGLVILTNDGQSAHKALSPKNHVEKTYKFETIESILPCHIEQIEKGVLLKDGYTTKPCRIKLYTSNSGEITLTEGKYHEIKRIFGALGNKITYLERISFGKINLDKDLPRGAWRFLTTDEIENFIMKS